MLTELLRAYESGADEPRRAIAGLSRAELCKPVAPGAWSIQQVVLHLLDSDLIAGERMKRIIAEDNPLILAYDETRFSQRLGYEHADGALAAEIFALHRAHMTALLRGLPAEAFERSGVHQERGRITLLDLVRTYAEHVPHHMRFVDAKRLALSK